MTSGQTRCHPCEELASRRIRDQRDRFRARVPRSFGSVDGYGCTDRCSIVARAARGVARAAQTRGTLPAREAIGRALAAVGGVPDETKGDLAKAYVVLKPGMETTREELIAHCRAHLAAYKVPRAVQFTTQVPMTSSGKIMRRLLTDIDDGAR